MMSQHTHIHLGWAGVGRIGQGGLNRRWFMPLRRAACLLVMFALPPASWSVSVEQMSVNGRSDPLGIATNDISFGWTLGATERGVVQGAYQIHVGTTEGGSDAWDSGWVSTNRQVDIALPSNIPLNSATRYYWQVNVKDGEGVESGWSPSAWFETGLLSESDWAGAEWITRPVASPDINDWTDYTATIDFTLESGAFGVFLRSSADAQNAYMMQVNVTDYSYPVLKPHKRTNGGYSLLGTVNLSSFGFSNASLTGTTNTLQFIVSGSSITTKLNGTMIDTRSDILYPNGLVGFRTYGSESAYVHGIEVANGGTTLINRDFSLGENGFGGGVLTGGSLYVSGNTDAIYANLPPSLPLLRGEFVADAGIAYARLYASAQGLYEISVNGQKAGDQFLAPGWTDYDQRIQAQTYDITDLVRPGTNAVGTALADGWYRGHVGIGWTGVYGNQIAFVGKIKIAYTNGTTQWFATDSGWKASDGPYVQGDLQNGEAYNANLERAGWNTAGFDDSGWLAVETVPNLSARLVPQPDEPIREIMELTAISRTEILPNTWIYDLGQNMVGVPKIVLSGTAGQTIALRHGEEIYRTGAKTGQLYTDNLRSANATDAYTFSANTTITFQPVFTQHGFRYIEITGTTNPPAITNVHGVVLSSDMPGNGDLQTSDAMLNQLVSNIRWGQRGNFLSIPTDTPARDERLGWTGDVNVFSPAAARYMDTRAFLSKWMTDVRDAQFGSGNIPAVVPRANGSFDSTGVGWADAFITIPYSVWKATGDERVLRENWAAMTNFYRFVYDSATGDGDLLEQGRSSWFSGDWLSLEAEWNRLEEHKVIGTAYFAENTRMMSEMAAALGATSQAAQWAALVPQIRAAFVAAYRNPDGSIYQGTQCVYAMALGMDMIADPAQREATATKFVETLAADNYHLQTGFLGTPWLLPALSRIGRDDLAMQMLLNEDYPSWGYPISIGATTMWERWNSINPDGTFGDAGMNSFNHYAYGAVGDWMFGNLGGIQALEPGYKASRIAPLIGVGGLAFASCAQDTAYGRLSTDWSDSETGSVLHIEIPVNTTAEVVLPESDGAIVYESSVPVDAVSDVQYLRTVNGAKVYSVGSGGYAFSWTPVLAGTPVSTQIVSWAYDNGQTIPPSGYAGVVSSTNWNVSTGSANLMDSAGAASGISLSLAGGFGAWGIGGVSAPDGDGTYNKAIFDGYYNSLGSTLTLGNIPYGTYDAIVYFSSDADDRTGTVADGATTYSFSTMGVAATSGGNAILTQTTDEGSGHPGADYAVFSSLTGSAQTFTIANASDGMGFAGLQVVALSAVAPPAAPSGLIAASGDAQVSLSWNAVSNATSYRVKRSLTSGGPYEVAAGLASTSMVDHWLVNGTTYYYVVSALGTGGESLNSFYASAVPSASVSPNEYFIADYAIEGGTTLLLVVSNSVPGHDYWILATEALTTNTIWSNIVLEAGSGSELMFDIPIEAVSNNRYFKLDVQRQ